MDLILSEGQIEESHMYVPVTYVTYTLSLILPKGLQNAHELHLHTTDDTTSGWPWIGSLFFFTISYEPKCKILLCVTKC